MDKYKRLGKNTLLILLGNAGSKLITLIMLPIYTHWLSPEEYGTTDVILSYSSLALGAISMCIADAIFVISKKVEDYEKKQLYTSGWFFSIVVFAITAIICYFIRYIALKTDTMVLLRDIIWYVYFVAFSSFIQSYTQSFTQAIDKLKIYSLTGVVNTAAIAGFAFIFIPHMGVRGYVYSIIAAYLCSAAFSFFSSKSYNYVDLRLIDRNELVKLLKYGMPLVPNTLMFWMVNGLTRPFVAQYVGLEANGILAVANKIPGIISALFLVFGNAWTISMIEEYDKPGFVKFFDNSIRATLVPVTIFACLLALFSEEVIRIIADAAYIEAYKYVPIAILGSLLAGISGMVGGIFAAKQQSKYFFYSSVWGATVSVLSMFLLIPRFQLYGATISVCLSFLAMVIARYLYTRKDLQGFKFDIVVKMLLGYIIIAVIVPLDISRIWKFAIGFLIIFYLSYSNKDVLTAAINKITKRYVEKNRA